MSDDRRQEFRREEDHVLAQVLESRVRQLEHDVRVYAPTATTVAVHDSKLHDGERRMKAIEGGLEALDTALDGLNDRVGAINIRLEGIAVKLALLVGGASVAGGGIVALVLKLASHST